MHQDCGKGMLLDVGGLRKSYWLIPDTWFTLHITTWPCAWMNTEATWNNMPSVCVYGNSSSCTWTSWPECKASPKNALATLVLDEGIVVADVVQGSLTQELCIKFLWDDVVCVPSLWLCDPGFFFLIYVEYFLSTLQCPTYSCKNQVIPVEFQWNPQEFQQNSAGIRLE